MVRLELFRAQNARNSPGNGRQTVPYAIRLTLTQMLRRNPRRLEEVIGMNSAVERRAGNALLLAAVLIAALGGSTVRADIIIGSISLSGDQPVAGLQQLQVTNLTGPGCSAFAPACTPVSFTGWSLAVDYTDTAGTHHSAFNWATSADDIGPGDSYSGQVAAPWVFDFSCSSGLCPPYDTVLTKVVFSATLSTTSIGLYGAGTFNANAVVTTTFIPAGDFAFFDSADLTATPATVSAVPEPGNRTFLLLMGASCAVFGLRAGSRLPSKAGVKPG
jgi:hypothetical protein